MPRHARGYTISTLQDHLDSGCKLTITCLCHHSQTLSIPKLIEIFGAGFDIPKNRAYFLSRFRCNACGKHANGVQMAPGNRPGM